MAYDIPPPLQHKEKIVFGLTFEQLIYAAPAFLIIVFLIFGTKFPIEFSGSMSVGIIIVTIFFMYFDGRNKIVNMFLFLKNQEVKINTKQLDKIIDLQSLKDDVLGTSECKLAVIEVFPINLMIRQEDEKESIIFGFQKFLNSLDFPVQFHVSSTSINLSKHFQRLEKSSKDKNIYQSYKDFINEKISEEGINNRRFVILIKEKYGLDIQFTILQSKLSSIGIRSRRLDTYEILDYLYDSVACKRQKELKDGDIVDKFGQYLISPEKTVFYHDFFQTDDFFCKVLVVYGYPHSVEVGFLDKIISSSQNYDLSIHVEPFPIDLTMIQLNQELQKQQSDLYSDSKKGIINPSLEIKYKSTRKVLEDLQKGKQKLFNVSLYIMCKGKTREEVSLLANKVRAELEGLMIQSRTPVFQSMDSYKSVLPFAKDTLKIKRNIHTQGLSAFFPFSSPFLDIDDSGILLGLNKNGIPYIKDIFKLTNANGVILATSGAGKSYFTKLMMSRQHLNGADILIIDPQGEYAAITQHYKGQVIKISKDSDTIINPLDLMGHDYLEKRLSLMGMFKIMFGDLSEIQKAILDKAIDQTYQRKGINKNRKDFNPPLMQDLYNVMKAEEKKCASQEKMTYRALLNRIGMYTDNGVFGFLNKQTNIDFKNDFVCFNIGEMPKQVKPVIMYLLLDYIYMRMKKSLKRKVLVIDEAWSLLQGAEESSYIFEIVKTCRKYNLGLLMITQDVADLLNSRAGQAVLANTSYTFLLRQKPAVIQSVIKTFNISQTEKEYLLTAEKGKGILILENEHQEIEVIASKKEHELITTNADEINQEKIITEPKENIEIKLNTNDDVYEAKKLTIEEKQFLSNNGYSMTVLKGLDDKIQQRYFIKKREPEGLKHTFYVDQIYERLNKKTDKIKKYLTEKSDIIFTNKKGEEIAIEIETAINVKGNRFHHNEKFSRLQKEYGKKCYIFLTNIKYVNSYTRHQLPIMSREEMAQFMKFQFSGKSNNTFNEKIDVAKRELSSEKI